MYPSNYPTSILYYLLTRRSNIHDLIYTSILYLFSICPSRPHPCPSSIHPTSIHLLPIFPSSVQSPSIILLQNIYPSIQHPFMHILPNIYPSIHHPIYHLSNIHPSNIHHLFYSSPIYLSINSSVIHPASIYLLFLQHIPPIHHSSISYPVRISHRFLTRT